MKTSELIGPALDWAVSKALGESDNPEFVRVDNLYGPQWVGPKYSWQWEFGGPILEREGISVVLLSSVPALLSTFTREGISVVLLYGSTWGATTYHVHQIGKDRSDAHYQGTGRTLLVAAMRCFVSIKLGDEVELPEKLQ